MAGFPPMKGKRANNSVPPTGPSNPVPTGKTIAQSLKVKDAGSVYAPGVEKNVNLF